MNKQSKLIIVSVIGALIIGGAAFYGGMVYGKSQVPVRGSFSGTRTGGRFAAGTSFITGQIIAQDRQSVTIKDRMGNSRIIFYSGSTDVGKFVTGNATDLSVGKTVMVNGKTNSDGSITAQSIQIRPAMPTPPPATGNQ